MNLIMEKRGFHSLYIPTFMVNLLIDTGYLACARCSSTGALVLIEPVSTVNSGSQPLSPPKTERCSNCSGAGKVVHLMT